jgi:hypothetical protein
MGKYFLEEIHASYPRAHCVLVVASNGRMIRDLLKAYPWISVREVNRTKPLEVAKLFVELWGSDATLTQYSGRGTFSLFSKLFARFVTKFERFAGFTDPFWGNRFLFDHLIPLDFSRSFLIHEQHALKALGIPLTVKALSFVCEESDILKKLQLTPRAYTILHLFAGTEGRGFSEEKKKKIVLSLSTNSPTILVTGGAGDRKAAEEACRGTNARVIAGETSVQELAYLIKHAQGVVSIDTGVAHMAAQMRVPLVVMRTCVARNWWMPEQYPEANLVVLECDGVCKGGHIAERERNCVNAIPESAVVDATRRLLF